MDRRPPTRARWLALGGWLLLLALVTAYALVDPATVPSWARCPLLAASGYYCPGCGSSRALHAALHGQLGAALRYNLLTLPAAAAVLWVLVGWTRWAWGAGPRPRWTGGRRRVALVIAVVLLYWLLRNLPVWPGPLLAPRG